MRRMDREIKEPKEIEAILEQAFVCHLGLVDIDTPYVVPLNYVYTNGHIYFHSAAVGRKLNLIRENPKVCFQMELYNTEIIKQPNDQPCEWGTTYKSVIGTGTAVILTDAAEKKAALQAIVRRFDRRDLPFSESDFAAVAVVRIDIEEMVGKKSRDS